jgi:hypothetical protein
MRIYEALFIVLAGCFIIYMATFYGRDNAKVYACHEVTTQDPKEVQDMCKRLTRKEVK